jgi:hypothetical protein
MPSPNVNVLYVTISTTSDQHTFGGVRARLLLACQVDSVPCNPGSTDANDIPGWITLANTTGDLHDNGGLLHVVRERESRNAPPREDQVRLVERRPGLSRRRALFCGCPIHRGRMHAALGA